jgi:hypothetical protein
MLLKISHDQLEKQYIIKPISIREIIYQIKQKIISNFEEKEIFNMLMNLLLQSLNIEKAAFVYVDLEKNNFKIISFTHDDFDFNIGRKCPHLSRPIENVPKLISQLKLNTQNQKIKCLHKKNRNVL